MRTIFDLLSMTVAAFYVIPIIMYFWTQDLFHLKVWVGYIFTTIVSEGLKYILKTLDALYNKYNIPRVRPVYRYRKPMSIKRPAGATDCNLWCNNGPQGGMPGMPSSHSAEVGYLAVVYGSQSHPVAWAVYAGLVMFSRYIKQCHTLGQIMMGGFLGAFIGFRILRFI